MHAIRHIKSKYRTAKFLHRLQHGLHISACDIKCHIAIYCDIYIQLNVGRANKLPSSFDHEPQATVELATHLRVNFKITMKAFRHFANHPFHC